MTQFKCMICDELLDPWKIPDELLYSPYFCSWACAKQSGMDRTLDGKNLASPAYIAGYQTSLNEIPDILVTDKLVQITLGKKDQK